MLNAINGNSTMTDPELVQLALQGDRQAFGDLIQRHWQKCMDVACYFLRNRSDSEDQVQNAFLKAYEHLDQYHGEAEFSTWLARIVANQCLMLMRVRRRTNFVYLDEPCRERRSQPPQLPSTEIDPEGALAYAQLTGVLRLEVGRIPSLMRNVIMLRDINGLPLKDVADQLGITVSAAKSRLVRARAEMRTRMKKHYTCITDSSSTAHSAAPLSRVGHHCPIRYAS